MSKKDLRLHEPVFKGNEKAYLDECIQSGWVSSAGPFVDSFENAIKNYTSSKHSVAVVNGTAALHLALKVLKVGADQEVIAPALTFIAPINAISYTGAQPVFIDCDEFFNIDINKTLDFLKEETFSKDGKTYNKTTKKHLSALIVVHVFGNAVFMDDLIDVCNKANIKIIEDACESLGTFYSKGRFKGRHTGTIGEIGCFSFNGNKIVTAGGGGAVISNNGELIKKIKYLSTQAKDNSFTYEHNEIGYNYRLTNLQAAVGLAQLEQIEDFLSHKYLLHNEYGTRLKDNDCYSLLIAPEYCRSNYWLNIISSNKFKNDYRDTLIQKFAKKNIEVRPIWKLNNQQKPYLRNQSYKVERANKLISNSICLPSGVGINLEDVQRICILLDE